MTSSAKYPEGFQLGKCQSLHEETKGTASFRMYPDLTGKKIHIEVWTPDMARRKQKCVAKGTELSTVAYYYGIFVDYSPQNSTKSQMIYLSATPIVIDGEYNAIIGVPSFDSKVKARFDYAVSKMEFYEAITGKVAKALTDLQQAAIKQFLSSPTCLISFPKGGIVKGLPHSNEEIILPPANKKGGVRHFELKKDGKLTVSPLDGDTIDARDVIWMHKGKTEIVLSDGDKIDFIDNLHECNFFKTPETSFEAPAPAEHPIKSIKRLLLEIKHLKEVMFEAIDSLDTEKYIKALLHYEANKRYIKTATEELKRITF